MEVRLKISQALIGSKPSPESIAKGLETRRAHGWYKDDKLTRQRLSEQHRGDKNHNWKGGLTAKHLTIRHSLHYRLWREAIFKRDGYRCLDCGAKSGESGKNVILNADHIYPFALYPRLRLMLENGRTLCAPCHRETKTYGHHNMKSTFL